MSLLVWTPWWVREVIQESGLVYWVLEIRIFFSFCFWFLWCFIFFSYRKYAFVEMVQWLDKMREYSKQSSFVDEVKKLNARNWSFGILGLWNPKQIIFLFLKILFLFWVTELYQECFFSVVCKDRKKYCQSLAKKL